jgi:hypothetical protein
MTNGKTRFFLAGMALTLIGSVMGVLGVVTAQAAGEPAFQTALMLPDEPKEPPSTTSSTTSTTFVEIPTTVYVAPTTTEAPQTAPEPPRTAPNAFLDCVKQRESGGNYGAYNPSGAAGAYQMLLSTSNTVAVWMGRSDLVGMSANNWSPADQDAGALVLYEHMGTSPWYYPPKPC